MKRAAFKNLLFFSILLCGGSVAAQEEQPEPNINLRYFNSNNKIQWLEVKATIRGNNKIEVLKDFPVVVYLDTIDPLSKIASLRTNNNGVVKTFLPITLKDKWNAAAAHRFVAVGKDKGKEIEAELIVAKAKIQLDTLNEEGLRTVKAQVLSFESGDWLPAKDVEIKIGVQRMGGAILIGEEESYTTDSLGWVSGEFKKDSLPAVDKLGNISLVAWTEDNEFFGNISVEKQVPWGQYFLRENNFDRRSLWATRDKAPVWLLISAYTIIAAVWGVLIYLIFQLSKIRKIGRDEDETRKPMKIIKKVVH